MGGSNPEANVVRNWLDLLSWPCRGRVPRPRPSTSSRPAAFSTPTTTASSKVKDLIIQHLAVMQLEEGQERHVLLLVGPPGVGKTSLGQSIAKAMGREFIRASLGGVRDDAEDPRPPPHLPGRACRAASSTR